ncbi:hypothetical protein N781_15540 [Pontibacillus halophilus JSM 076056 = DSM 19796]|uniref:Uncharacterized protein n=1 Tax=Pontibacillus halophilus JSM 076056 = DSM 19796 TaxID=1385510 RepID=A0A0A5GN94_9BACI|nr:hypothetical protein [Pontibacillus halophilus]KGX92723.1 hypothetical protein N781_15540 [Pontibacillus halophilus JSM 076056 = DSM 19796]
MSEKKKRVIHVDDLVIHAENVIIEPRRQRPDDRPRRMDPFFGNPRYQEAEAAEAEVETEEVNEEAEATEEADTNDEQQRPPFSWI